MFNNDYCYDLCMEKIAHEGGFKKPNPIMLLMFNQDLANISSLTLAAIDCSKIPIFRNLEW